MAKQPYIPFYCGDYIKDTRKLPLAARGAWMDLLLFMWDEDVRGEIIDTMEGFAGMLSCTVQEAEFALNLLKQKNVCGYEDLPNGRIKIISRRMKRDIYISAKRSESGKKGVFAKNLLKQNPELASAKKKQNPDIDNDIDSEVGIGINSVFNWENEKSKFLQGGDWIFKVCRDKKLTVDEFDALAKDFLADCDLKEDYKPIKELRSHFINLFNKKKNAANSEHSSGGNGKQKLGTSAARIETAKKW